MNRVRYPQEIIEVIKTQRLELRLLKFSLDLAKKMYEQAQASIDELKPYLEWSHKLNGLEDYIEYLIGLKSTTSFENSIHYGIFLENKFIGQISITCRDLNAKRYELSYWISTVQAGHGYMTEAAKALEKTAFLEYKVNRIEITADTQNVASNKVIQKLKYKLEGVLKEHKFSQFYKSYRDVNIYAKLRKEYQEGL